MMILPYHEELEQTNGAFINPEGKIFYVDGKHDEFAQDYCHYNLSDREKTLLELWQIEEERKEWYTDFLVRFLMFDKVEMLLKKTMTSSAINPHIRLYNYYLMSWGIYLQPGLIFNRETNTLDTITINPFGVENQADREAETEINELKAQVRTRDLPLFFKN